MKNWKTTLTGLAIGGGYTFLSYLQQGLKARDAAIGVGFVILGALAKDFDVTGIGGMARRKRK
jgi:hypothetical protein